ncbi:M81 family metallopeptidase [Limobrevibacterium gyesilva]|uniref:Microcystinase C n=1 Tax=Limobrevibacterium gyesilva TaxID=2991712 RepID=A0AA42CEP2_9PROT|nr:M81 family metallopeptidase [Limobrevibacterium gyesilva]MCW3475534.1 M81 family metallopeptidase [Limobrevibacterium gyesilva]
MRIFAASLGTETNTFAPIPTDRRSFETAFYCPPGTHPDTPTLCSAPIVAARRFAAEGGHTLIEGTATWAEPAGIVGRSTYEGLRDEILGQLRAALPVDVVLFGLHGCMVAHGYDDCEGDLLTRARALAPGAVIGAELDLHAHLSDAMVQAADVIVAFKEFPHTDFLARAEELTALCLRTAEGRIKPAAGLFDCRSIGGYMTSREPGRSFVDRLMAMEGRDGILSISVIHGFQAADVYDVGTKVLVYADGDQAKAAALAEQLGREVISWGASGVPVHLKPAEAVAEALRTPGGPVVLADRWDNPGGGVAGDSTFLIEELLKHPDIPSAVGALWDPGAAAFCVAAGPGAELPLRFGGKAAATSGRPIDALVRIRAATDDLRIPFEQSIVSLGPSAAVTIGTLDVVLATGRAQTFNPAVFTELGIDLGSKKIVVVKSSNHFHAAFAPLAAAIIYVDCGGPYPPDPAKIPYTKIRRPIAPLDPNPWL